MINIKTPIGMIAAFLGFMDTVLTTGVVLTSGSIQLTLLTFMILFTSGIVWAFFHTLWNHPEKLYSPSEYGSSAEFLDAVHIVKVKADEVEKIAKRVEELKIDLEKKIADSTNYAIDIALCLTDKS